MKIGIVTVYENSKNLNRLAVSYLNHYRPYLIAQIQNYFEQQNVVPQINELMCLTDINECHFQMKITEVKHVIHQERIYLSVIVDAMGSMTGAIDDKDIYRLKELLEGK